MDNIIKLVSPMCPSVNHYLATRAIVKNGKPMAMIYETQEAKKYKKDFCEYIKEQIKIQNWTLPVTKTQHFYCDCVFYFDRIDKDCNNYFKLLLDSITETGLVWADDNVVCERVNRIYYDSNNPRIELTIYPVEYIGIFESEKQKDLFIENCIDCTKYKQGKCSILKKALEGRIQEEIDMSSLVCKKYKE